MRSKASKTPSRDRRAIQLKSGLIDVTNIDIANHNWLRICQKFPKPHRKQLTEAKILITTFTSMYGSSLAQDRKIKSLSSVIQEIELWRKRTAYLRSSVWLSEPREAPQLPPAIGTVVQSHFKPAVSKSRLEEPLDYFALFLDGVTFVADQYLKELADPDFKSIRTTDLWVVWAALIIHSLTIHGVPVGEISPRGGIVALFTVLQDAILELRENSRTSSTKKSPRAGYKAVKRRTSLPKGIRTALSVSDRFSFEEVLAAFLSWSTGDYQAGESRIEASPVTRIAHYLAALSTKGHDGKKNI